MGITDTVWFKLTCDPCETKEVHPIHDKGSSFSGPNWQAPPPFEHFDVKWESNGSGEPNAASATCNGCDAAAGIESRYCLSRPDGF